MAPNPPIGRFSTDPRSVSDARQFAARAVAPVHPDLCDAVMLMVSELATNAIRHGRSDYSVDVRVQPMGVRVEVTDRGPRGTGGSGATFPARAGATFPARAGATFPAGAGATFPAGASGHPSPGESLPRDSGGRGLRIVEALADVWGVVAQSPGAGRTVWFEIRADRADGPPHSMSVTAPPRTCAGAD